MNQELQETLQAKYQESLELEQKMQIADQQIEEINQVVAQLEKLGSEEESFMPLGQGVFVKAHTKGKFLVGVGAGVFIEKNKEEAIRGCETRSSVLLQLKNRLMNELAVRTEEMRKIIQKTI